MLQRLIQSLHNADADIYIQLDAKANIQDFAQLETMGNVWFVKQRVTTGWGNYSIIQATLNGFNYILQTGKNYSHLNLLSGQDYPIKPIAQIQQFLFANADKTFLSSFSIADGEWLHGNTRIAKYSFGDYNFPGKYQLQNIINKLLPNRKPPYHLKPYGRSQWLTITPECAEYAINYLAARPRLKHFFRMTWAVDEVFFQTILENSPLKDTLVNDNLRYIDQDGGNRPTIFTIANADMLMASEKLFARKFDLDVDKEIYDYLDNALNTSVK